MWSEHFATDNCNKSFQDMMKAARKCLGNNFLNSMIVKYTYQRLRLLAERMWSEHFATDNLIATEVSIATKFYLYCCY